MGQGGYYSPQEYVLFAVPVNWRQRTRRTWSWELGASVPSSTLAQPDRTAVSIDGPDPSQWKEDASDDNQQRWQQPGLRLYGASHRGRCVTSNWFVGAGVDIQQAGYYTPSHALRRGVIPLPAGRRFRQLPAACSIPYADWQNHSTPDLYPKSFGLPRKR
ncbi:cellulose synthase subunit BcsC-related outer membrane protein [Shigella flexneri]